MQDRILTETLLLMNERGLNFTIAELARQLAVSKRKIYQYFISKEHLVVAVLDEILADLQQQVKAIVRTEDMSTVTRLEALMVASPKALGPLSARIVADIKRLLPQEWQRFEFFFKERWEYVAEVFQEGVKDGVFRPVSLDILWKIYRGSINELGDYQFLTQNNCTFQSTMEKTVDILIYGLISDGFQQRDISQELEV